MISDAPHVQLLIDAKTALESGDWVDAVGVSVKIRHQRHRKTSPDERPCLALMFVSDGPPDEGTDQISHWEKIMQSEWEMIVDADLANEESEDDPTGVGFLSRIVAYALQLLRDPARGFGNQVHEIVDGTKTLDEGSQPDKGRLSRSISVIYRVMSEDENLKL